MGQRSDDLLAEIEVIYRLRYPAFLREPADERVRAAIAGLPERQRLVLFLRYFADLDYRAIARVMEIRPGTVAASLNAGRTAVKQSIEKEIACP